MAKVYGLHQLQLRDGVDPEEFERYVYDEIYPIQGAIGEAYLLKGFKGERDGKYLFMLVWESREDWDRWINPTDDAPQDLLEIRKEAFDKYGTMTTMASAVYTDYVVLGK